MAMRAAIFFTGHCSARTGMAARRARASQNMVPGREHHVQPGNRHNDVSG
jgi:hypothetical protein